MSSSCPLLSLPLSLLYYPAVPRNREFVRQQQHLLTTLRREWCERSTLAVVGIRCSSSQMNKTPLEFDSQEVTQLHCSVRSYMLIRIHSEPRIVYCCGQRLQMCLRLMYNIRTRHVCPKPTIQIQSTQV
jgi:hypothetical protein